MVTTWGYNLKKGVNNSVSYSDSTPGIQYAYNYLNQLTQVTDASGSRVLTYTPCNEPDTDSITIGGSSYQLQEHYDTYGRSSGYTLKQGTDVLQEASQGYEADGRLASAGIRHGGTEQSFAYGYLAGSSLLSSLAMPDGIIRELAYEQRRNLVTAINCRLGETVFVSRTQSCDALGRPVTRTQQRGTEPARSDSFSYNGRNELTAATLGADPYGYSYDNIGNRKTAREPAGELAYAANGLNQYTGIEESGEAPFVPTYDASGNQTLIKTSTGVWTVVYNAANRAVSFTSRNGNTIIECGYDYQGRRYMKKVTQNGTVASHERYLYRGYLQIAPLDMLDNRNVLRTLLWDPLEPMATRPLALVQGASLYCYGTDFNKNVTEVFDAQGTIAAAYDYSPYGAVTGTGSLVQPVQWSGEMHDEELALVYYNYRYYNPADGRWINRDPIAEEGGWNLYSFNKNIIYTTDYLGLLSLGRFITKRLIGKIKKSLITDLNGPYIPGYWEEDAENSGIIAICLKCKGTNKPFKINLGNNPNRIGNTTTLCNGWEKIATFDGYDLSCKWKEVGGRNSDEAPRYTGRVQSKTYECVKLSGTGSLCGTNFPEDWRA
ncbi:RHS repeat domain-containing protein [Akkermansia muciniphila]|uniref:RHS repeat domain-containing protein n=1 Tax=Akkermansia muciniphila TaxID=239935 RepID=UPI0021B40FCA|nr:RHS repeat-associated core domain-containing protein [Akkermansia muciniphila]